VKAARYGPPLAHPRPATDLEQAFWERCARGRLEFQRCSVCQRWRHPPRAMCAGCGSLEWSWCESGGRGRIFSWSLTHRAPHPSLAESVPFATVIVELEEGVRLVSVVRDLEPAALRLDLPVRVDFEELEAGVSLPVFRAGAEAQG